MCSIGEFSNNRRLFFGNIPKNKTRDEIWKALLMAGITNIVDVICYKAYSAELLNRGFVFVEFTNWNEAKKARIKYRNSLKLFGKKTIIDWATPIRDVQPDEIKQVKKLFIRNLPVTMTRNEFVDILSETFINLGDVVKIYKFKDYSFIHFKDRESAERSFEILKNYFDKDIEVSWAIPLQTNVGNCSEKRVNFKYTEKKDTSSSSCNNNTFRFFPPSPSSVCSSHPSHSFSYLSPSSPQLYNLESNYYVNPYVYQKVQQNCSCVPVLRKSYIPLDLTFDLLQATLQNKTLQDVINECGNQQ